jgi:hypothetical protein
MTEGTVGKIRVVCKLEANIEIIQIELIKGRYHPARSTGLQCNLNE